MNRALAAKAERAKRQAREFARTEYSKPAYARHETIGAANALRLETATLVAQYQGKIKHLDLVKPRNVVGSKRAGYGTRSDLMVSRVAGGGMRSVLTPDVYGFRTRLIRAGQ